jgi:tRNA-binding protein
MNGEELYDVNDFWKFDMRVGHILSAEKIERTKKLIKLYVDLGAEKRTVVAGIGDQYGPEDLKDKKMIFVVNLKPKKLSGIVSEAMLVVAEEEGGKVHLITVSDEVPPGTKVW